MGSISGAGQYSALVRHSISGCTARILRQYHTMGQRFILSSLYLLSIFLPSSAMDYGRSGVYDSPMVTDYYVKRFGFLFGGGRSGAAGLAALQKTADLSYKASLPASLYNPSGLYGLRAMRNSVYDFPQPRLTRKRTFTASRLRSPAVAEKKMVELSPLRREQQSFSRF